MNIGIRVDASTQIGTGHVMRTLVLARALSSFGRVTFICRPLAGNLGERIVRDGFELIWLDAETAAAAHNEQIAEAERLLALLPTDLDLLIVDSYRLGKDFCTTMRAKARHILVIDDLADRAHDGDWLLDQNLYSDMHSRYMGLVPKSCVQLLGPRFCLLRDEFCAPKADVSGVSASSRDGVLLFFGGADSDNLTGKSLNALKPLVSKGLRLDVVLGAANPHADALLAQFGDSANIRWHRDCDYMAALMAGCALSLGAGGSSHWERAMMGCPSLVVTVADNQRTSTAYLASLGACHWLGDKENVDEALLLNTVCEWLEKPEQALAMAATARALMGDTPGPQAVAAAIMNKIGDLR